MPSDTSTVASAAILRALSYRIGAATPHELPHVVASASSSIIQCKNLLSQPQSLRQKDGEAGLVAHRFSTQITTLLQGRSATERWAAAVLIKATIEAGGWETLSRSAHWVTGLVNNLKKSDPAAVKTVTIMTVTRVFTLTWDHASLVREITTPSLPGFLAASLSSCNSSSASLPVVAAVLRTCITLVPRHPTIFRSYSDKLLHLSQSILDDISWPEPAQTLASRLSVLLHQSKAKDNAASSWSQDLTTLVANAHGLLDQLLEGVQEQWQPSKDGPSTARNPHLRHNVSSRVAHVYTCADKLRAVLLRLNAFFSTPLASVLHVKLGLVMDLWSRLSAIAGSLANPTTTIQFAHDITRDEQHSVLHVLPALHTSMLRCVSMMVQRHGSTVLPVLQTLLDQILWVFQAESREANVRAAVYAVITAIVQIEGFTMSKESVSTFAPVIKACCNDIINLEISTIQPDMHTTHKLDIKVNADSISRRPSTAAVSHTTSCPTSASALTLLPAMLACLPSRAVSDAMRTLMDRTAVLTRHKKAMLASVLNPPAVRVGQRAVPSLLPLLAREYPNDPQVDALIRPRMPIIQTAGQRRETTLDEESEADDEQAELNDQLIHEDYEARQVGAVMKRTADQHLEPDPKRRRAESGAEDESNTPGGAEVVNAATVAPAMFRVDQPADAAASGSNVPVTASAHTTNLFASSNYTALAPSQVGTIQLDASVDMTAAEDDEEFEMPDLDLREDSDEDA